MTVNLKIGSTNLVRTGNISITPDASIYYPETNVCVGSRRNIWKGGSSATYHVFTWDLGSGVTKAVDYLWIARADLLLKYDDSIGFELERSPDNSAWTAVDDDVPLTSGNLCGRDSEDYFVSISLTSAYRYWRIKIRNNAITSIQPSLSKFLFGELFDFGRDPIYGVRTRRKANSISDRDPRYVFNFIWVGVSNAKVKTLTDEILNYMDVGSVILVTDSYSDVLRDLKCINCRIIDYQIEPVNHDNNRVSITFEEVV